MGYRNDEEQQEEIETESQETDNNPVGFAEFTSKDCWDEYQLIKFWALAFSEAFEIRNTASLSEDDLNGHIVKLKTKTEELFAIADSGSPMDAARILECYNGRKLISKRRLIITIESRGWKIKAAPFIIVDDQKQTS